MNRRRDVKPITYLKSRTADLVREVNEGGSAVTITQNGQPRVVVMDVDTYDRWRAAMALLKMLAQAEADVTAGRTVSHRDAFRRARAALDRQGGDG
jgi:prevent-host-death family protein